MYLMYADESGDSGMPSDGSPTRYFCLSGVVVHERYWKKTIDDLLAFRKGLKQRYGIPIDAELHSRMIAKPGDSHLSIQALKRHQRLELMRLFASTIGALSEIRIVNVVVDKQARVKNKDEVFRWAWYSLFQRFENTIKARRFVGPDWTDELGIIFPDNTDGGRLRKFLSDMRQNNHIRYPVQGGEVRKNEPIQVLIEDPVMRDSKASYLIQAADCAAFLLKQHIEPSSYMKLSGGKAYFQRLGPVLCRAASRKGSRRIRHCEIVKKMGSSLRTPWGILLPERPGVRSIINITPTFSLSSLHVVVFRVTIVD